jgi:hypothetical protein
MRHAQEILIDYPFLVFAGPLLLSILLWVASYNLRQAIALSFSLPLGIIYAAMFAIVPTGHSINYAFRLMLAAAPQIFPLTIVGAWLWIQFARGKFGNSDRYTSIMSVVVILIAAIGHAWTSLLLIGLGPAPPPTG